MVLAPSFHELVFGLPLRSAGLSPSALVTATTVPVTPRRRHAGPPREPDAPTVMKAEDMNGRPEREINLDANVVIERGKTTKMTADTACYRQVEDEFEAEGHQDVALRRLLHGRRAEAEHGDGQGFPAQPLPL
jgi:LPS-assembly protein